jgi:transcriptional regulator
VYIPEHFRETDLARLDWLAAHDAFGTLISNVDGAPFATHLPVLYARHGQQVVLTGHWARPNGQWRDIESQRVLFIFHGPHVYISPRWYTDPARNVPTWNYATAHVYGRAKLIQEVEALERIVDALAHKYESGAAAPWRLTESNPGNRRSLGGIVGFELNADEVQIKYKLNQNHPAANVTGAIAALEAGDSPDGHTIATLMQEALERRESR